MVASVDVLHSSLLIICWGNNRRESGAEVNLLYIEKNQREVTG